MDKYVNQLKDEKFNIKKSTSTKRKNKCYDIFTFDVENCNAWIDEDDNVIGYEKGHSEDYWNSKNAIAVVYIWQFSYNDTVYYGRDLREFLTLLDDLPKDAECIIYVHNLAHEFMFLLSILTVDKVFARAPHKPMKCNFKEFPNIEFRCSYILENLSLEDWGKQLGCEKLVGLLDYDKLYTPLSQLDDDALRYAEQDCKVVYQGIKRELETYGNVFDVPLTSTGKIRRVCKDLLFQDKSYRNFIKSLVPSLDVLKMLQKCYAGGYCHCNALWSNKEIYATRYKCGKMTHWDFTSSYPTVLFEKYPCSRWHKRSEKWIPKFSDKYAFMYTLKFRNIQSINPNTYLQISKCKTTGNVVKDNGRIKSCDGELTISCTDLDYEIIKMLYKWDYVEVIESYYAKKDYLCKAFLSYILELYNNKTKLKGVKGQENFYQQQKAFLNSLYGMCVTSMISPEVEFINDEWVIHPKNSDDDICERLRSLGDTRKKGDTRYFLGYDTGVWCCAYARYNLFRCMINEQTHYGYDVCYCDTDSLFILGTPNFDWYNAEVDRKLKECCNARGIDFDLTRPVDIKGKSHPLGWFDREEDIKEFKCIHAKCYIERRFDDKLYMTISGINKSAVELLNNDIQNFADGFRFDFDADCVHKLMPTYNYCQPEVTFPDGYVSTYPTGKNLRRTGYKIGITDEYSMLLKAFNMTYDDIDERAIIKYNGRVV